jgi:hypothetical protein
MKTVKPNMPTSAIRHTSSQSFRSKAESRRRWPQAKGASTAAPSATRKVAPTKTGMASVTILETGVAEPKTIIPSAS